MSIYNEDYYERGIELGISGYSNYRWMPELTIPMAARLCEILNISDDDKILDFGCAKGFLVKSFRLLHKQCWGFDISKYALQNVPTDVKKYISSDMLEFGNFDWVIAKDVFEHIEYDNIDKTLVDLSKITKNLFCIIPIGNNGKYIIPTYEGDKTHTIRESLSWWKDKFKESNFKVIESVYRKKYLKENWSSWEKGNGFFTLSSRKYKESSRQ